MHLSVSLKWFQNRKENSTRNSFFLIKLLQFYLECFQFCAQTWHVKSKILFYTRHKRFQILNSTHLVGCYRRKSKHDSLGLFSCENKIFTFSTSQGNVVLYSLFHLIFHSSFWLPFRTRDRKTYNAGRGNLSKISLFLTFLEKTQWRHPRQLEISTSVIWF